MVDPIDLCTIEDIKNEAYTLNGKEDFDTVIQARITKFSKDIINDSENPNLPDDKDYSKNACIYKVCDWLEKNRVIPGIPKEVKSETEGDRSRTYGVSNEDENPKPVTYNDWYWYYFSKIKKNVSVGITV